MPIASPPSYPILEDVMLLARSLVNDTFPGATGTPGEGQIFTDSAPFTVPMINSAIRELYREMGNNGVATLIQDNVIVSGLTPVNGPLGLGIPDPSVQVSLTFAGYFDGTTTNASLKLPANTLAVQKMWERQTNSGNPFTEMTQSQFGLPSRYQVGYFADWEYRQDGIYLVGSINTTDVRMRNVISLPAQVSGNGSDFSSLSVPLMDSSDALAWKLVKFYSFRLGTDAVQVADGLAKEAVAQLVNRQVRQKQAIQYHPIPYGDWGYTGTNTGFDQ